MNMKHLKVKRLQQGTFLALLAVALLAGQSASIHAKVY